MDGAAGAFDAGSLAGLKRSVSSRLTQFGEQVLVDFVAIFANPFGFATSLNRCNHTATGFMQMAAVVKPAAFNVGSQVGHISRQLCWINVIKTEFLEAG